MCALPQGTVFPLIKLNLGRWLVCVKSFATATKSNACVLSLCPFTIITLLSLSWVMVDLTYALILLSVEKNQGTLVKTLCNFPFYDINHFKIYLSIIDIMYLMEVRVRVTVIPSRRTLNTRKSRWFSKVLWLLHNLSIKITKCFIWSIAFQTPYRYGGLMKCLLQWNISGLKKTRKLLCSGKNKVRKLKSK